MTQLNQDVHRVGGSSVNPSSSDWMTPSLPQPEGMWARILPLGVVALGAGLALYSIGSKSFWVDEAVTYFDAKQSLEVVWKTVTTLDASMPLYYFFMHFWLHLGSSEAVMRLPSALFGVASVYLIYALGRAVFDRTTGLVAALLLATNGFLIHYEQEARGYVMVTFFAVLSTYLLVRALQSHRRLIWAPYFVSIGLAVATHATALFVIAAQLISLLVAGPVRLRLPRWSWRRAAFVGPGLALFAVASILVLRRLSAALAGGGWAWISPTSKGRVLEVFGLFSGGGQAASVWISSAICLVAIVIGIVAFRRFGRSFTSWGYALAAGLVVVPIVAALAISALVHPFFVDRYLIVALPGFILLTAAGVARLRPTGVAWLTLFVLVIFCGRGVNYWFVGYQKDDFRAATSAIEARARATDAIVFIAPFSENPFNYYAYRMSGHGVVPSVTFPTKGPTTKNPIGAPQRPLEAFRSFVESKERVWLLMSNLQIGNFGELAAKTTSMLSNHDRLLYTQAFHGVAVALYERSSPSLTR
jgi:uncharacterized membrane protein